MLTVHVPVAEYFDETTNRFSHETFAIDMEHSLVSLSKWESFFEKPFLSDTEKTPEELMWYVKAMTLTPNVPPEIYNKMTEENGREISAYINAKMTATKISEIPGQSRASREIITAEIIYYWMVSYQIPVEFENWHLSRLLMLIRVCNEKNKPQKKMSRRDVAQRQRDLNAQRKAMLGTTG